MNILVTGGAGFIGSHLCEYLVGLDHRVTVVDDLSSGHLANLNNVIDHVEFYNSSVENFDFEQVGGVDALVHLAAQASVPVSVESFGRSSTANLVGTIRTLDFCRYNKIAFIYASSAAIYGNLEIGNDENSGIELLSPYATDKFAMECYANMASKLYEFSSIGLRFYNVYGPKQDPSNSYSGVISIFCDRVLKRESLIINGGFQSRDFVYVEDVVKAIYSAVVVARDNEVCEQINVLTGKSITIDELADLVMSSAGVQVDKIYREFQQGDPERSKGTTGKLQGVLLGDLKGMVSIDEGLFSTIEYLKR